MCCKLVDVPGLAARDVWCPHAKPGQKGGCCAIYATRPPVCEGFDCLWKKSEIMKSDMKPDRCGIVFEHFPEQNMVIVMVEKFKADRWKKEPARSLIYQMLKEDTLVWVIIGKERHMLLPKGMTQTRAKEITELAYMSKMRKTEEAA